MLNDLIETHHETVIMRSTDLYVPIIYMKIVLNKVR